jgi:hypothetical protein
MRRRGGPGYGLAMPKGSPTPRGDASWNSGELLASPAAHAAMVARGKHRAKRALSTRARRRCPRPLPWGEASALWARCVRLWGGMRAFWGGWWGGKARSGALMSEGPLEARSRTFEAPDLAGTRMGWATTEVPPSRENQAGSRVCSATRESSGGGMESLCSANESRLAGGATGRAAPLRSDRREGRQVGRPARKARGVPESRSQRRRKGHRPRPSAIANAREIAGGWLACGTHVQTCKRTGRWERTGHAMMRRAPRTPRTRSRAWTWPPVLTPLASIVIAKLKRAYGRVQCVDYGFRPDSKRNRLEQPERSGRN